MMMDSKSVRNM